MDHHLVAGLPLGDALADLPDDAGGVRAADVMAPLGVVAVAEHGDGLAERRPDVVEVDPGGHHPDDHLEGARLRQLDLLELEGVLGLALALGPDHPGGHRLRQLARLDVELRDLGYVYGHGAAILSLDAPSAFPSGVRDYLRGSPWKHRRSHSCPLDEAAEPQRGRRARARRPAGDRAAHGQRRARRAGRPRARRERPAAGAHGLRRDRDRRPRARPRGRRRARSTTCARSSSAPRARPGAS